MRSHQLARILLSIPDLPISTHANNHTALDEDIKVGYLKSYVGKSIIIGNMHRMNLNTPNWFMTKMIYGKV